MNSPYWGRGWLLMVGLACLQAATPITPIYGQGGATQQRGPASPPPPTLRTRWAAQVTPEHVLPEYPRPQLVRPRWTNLNGRWEYAIRDSNVATAPDRYDGTILVPFPIESQLSGVQKAVRDSQVVWYRRTFRAPTLAHGERLLLHFGAVDWRATVFVNGHQVVTHTGGYDPFTADITDALSRSGEQTVTVRVWDPTDAGAQPRGKQTQHPQGIFYTSVTGIWQTVWLEPVPATYIAGLNVTTNIDAGTVTVQLSEGNGAGNTVGQWQVVASANGKRVATANGAASNALVLHIPNAKLWSPDDPFLYDLDITLNNGGVKDRVQSYVGLRQISVCKDASGMRRLCLNHQPRFEFGPLDQGWWPDGLYTAPTDEALKFDVEQTKRIGFNMIRKHIKVEPERWYYYTDKLGVLVWQDMPSGDNDTPAGKAAYRDELKKMVDDLRNHPSIVMWVPFNEGWGQHDTERVAGWLMQYDTTRLVNNASGWSDMHMGHVADAHVYPGPGLPPYDTTRAMVLGEFGGLGLPTKGHMWVEQNNWGYRTFKDTTELATAYRKLLDQLQTQIAEGLSAAVYTQTTDVETEANGLFTYDRAVLKLPANIANEHAALYKFSTQRRVILPRSWESAQTWRYTRDTPDSAWTTPGYDDQRWAEGAGGFGQPLPAGYARAPTLIGTRWETPEIWLRRTFTLDPSMLTSTNLCWQIDLMGEATVYLNGKLVGHFQGSSGPTAIPLDTAARAALQAGTNTIAVYGHRVRPLPASSYIDIGLDELRREP